LAYVDYANWIDSYGCQLLHWLATLASIPVAANPARPEEGFNDAIRGAVRPASLFPDAREDRGLAF